MDTLPRIVVNQAKLQCFAALSIGLLLIVAPRQAHENPLTNYLTTSFGLPKLGAPSTPLEIQLSAISGVFAMAIGFCYAVAFAHGYEEWLYISIPVRLFATSLSLLVWLLSPEKMSPVLVTVIFWDGGVALLAAYLTGNFTGRKMARGRAIKET